MENWTRDEMMVYAAAQAVGDNDVVLVGTGLPLVAAYHAKRSHAPGMVMLFESGVIDPVPGYIAVGPGDFPLIASAVQNTSLFNVLAMAQRGVLDVAFLGGAQIDPYGNINTTAVGSYQKPRPRLSGSGGANDIASFASRTVIIARHQRRRFVEKLDYLTTPGHLDGPGARERAGLSGGGPAALITDLGVFVYDSETLRMRVQSLHPGVSADEAIRETGFEVLGLDALDIPQTPLGDAEELAALRQVDPAQVYLNSR